MNRGSDKKGVFLTLIVWFVIKKIFSLDFVIKMIFSKK
ncbi:hypothetical protein L932_05000 [Helicobacter pylori PZ5026]|nr:hypothetical protein L932_05000 [Helicobacter pylori PZ5026]